MSLFLFLGLAALAMVAVAAVLERVYGDEPPAWFDRIF